MSNTETFNQDILLPESKLDSKVLELIKIFVDDNKDKYKPYTGLSEDYQDCMVYSKKLYELLLPFLPNLKYLYVSSGKETVKLFGSMVEIPSPAIHAALVDPSLGIVIEPQTGRITYSDDSMPNSALEYYKKGLNIANVVFSSSNDAAPSKAS